MYQALYRKYRPRRFDDVAGQEHITETLRRQLANGRLSHAYLFIGTRGTGKTTCAKILSRAVNCENLAEGEPCNSCNSCIGIEDGSILEVLELDAASNNSVDNVRALRDEAIYSPASVKKRVYIVDEVHMLSLSAFNALLKILEEPPEHTLFILATTELHKVPATIQSRCQTFSFKRLPHAVLAARLNLIASSEGLKLTENAASKLAALADGSMRDAVSLLDQCVSDDVIDSAYVLDTLGLVGRQELARFAEAIVYRDPLSALSILDELYNDGKDMAALIGEFVTLFRDVLVFSLSPDSGLLSAGFDSNILSFLTEKMTHERLFYCLDVLKTALSSLPRSGGTKLSVEMCLIRMCNERLSDDTGALLSRISSLEAGRNALTTSVNCVENTDLQIEPIITGDDERLRIEPAMASEEVTGDDESLRIEPAMTGEGVTGDDERLRIELAMTCEGVTGDDERAEPGDLWPDILDLLKSDPSVYALLSDSYKVQALLSEDTLNIYVTDLFTANMIESGFSGPLKEAAGKVLGRDMIVRVEITDSSGEIKHSKLENLSMYDNVKFE